MVPSSTTRSRRMPTFAPSSPSTSNQLSKGRFAPPGYLDHIGLEISRPLLHEAFYQTYGLNLRDVIGDQATATKIYRKGVRHFLPNIAEAEAILHKKRFPQDTQSDEFGRLR